MKGHNIAYNIHYINLNVEVELSAYIHVLAHCPDV